MRDRSEGSMITVVIAAAAVGAVISVSGVGASAQVSAVSVTAPGPAPAVKTPWGEPDLQGIWTEETDTPLQRSPKYAGQEFFTEAQRQELDRERATLLGTDRRLERGTERDVAGAYNTVFLSMKRTRAPRRL
jgi:hypothetical protein